MTKGTLKSKVQGGVTLLPRDREDVSNLRLSWLSHNSELLSYVVETSHLPPGHR